MILKKPYAFLIKHFRIIHLILVAPIIYLIIKTHNIVQFFSDYVGTNYYTNITNIAGTYINYFMYLSVIAILLVGVAIYFLMRQKEKSTKFYFFLLVFYVVLFVMIGITHSILSGMELNTLEATTALAFRDISYLFYLPQFFFAAFTIFRGVGFDLKKFNFEVDIKELEISDIDSEEFELNIGIEDYKIKRNIRRFIREFKYYIRENQFIFMILCTIFVITIGTLIYLNRGVYNKTYRETQILSHNNLSIKVLGSLLTNRDYGGKEFSDNKHYVVVQLSIENRGKDSSKFDYNNFFIEMENRRIYPILDRAEYFLDCGFPLREDTELSSGSKNTYVLAYEISKEEIQKEYKLKILEQVSLTVGQITPQYKLVDLKPEVALEIENKGTTKMGKIATFEDSNIKYSSLQIKSYDILDSYTYQYERCSNSQNCQTLNDKLSTNSSSYTLLILEGEYTVDENVLYYKTAKTNRLFPNHFLTVQYEDLTGAMKTVKIENKTPTTYQKGLILQVPKDIKQANKINLLVTIRNKQYTINLKE